MCCINNPEHRVIIPQDVDLKLLGQLLRDDLRLSDDDSKLYQSLRILDKTDVSGYHVCILCELVNHLTTAVSLLSVSSQF
jgi:hypothetical protein